MHFQACSLWFSQIKIINVFKETLQRKVWKKSLSVSVKTINNVRTQLKSAYVVWTKCQYSPTSRVSRKYQYLVGLFIRRVHFSCKSVPEMLPKTLKQVSRAFSKRSKQNALHKGSETDGISLNARGFSTFRENMSTQDCALTLTA